MIQVAHLMRRPEAGLHYSVEGLFETVRAYMPAGFDVRAHTAPRMSRGVAGRIHNVMWARRFAGQLVHVTGDITYVVPALGSRAIMTVLDTGWVRRGAIGQAMFELLWYRLPARRSLALTTISEFSRGELSRITGLPASRIDVIPACHDPIFAPLPESQHDAKPILLVVGTTPNKNIERLAAAAAGLECTIHVVGRLSESQTDALRRHALDWRNSVGLSKPQLLEAYAAATIVAFPSLYEGFGLPIVEGQAVGRPVLTSRLTAMPEVSGNAACLIDPHDVASIRSGLRRLLADGEYRRELRERGFENARRFAPPRIAAQYAALYQRANGP